MKRRWTPSEENLLASRWADEPCKPIAEALNRSPSSVYQHAVALGLEKSQDYYQSAISGRMQRGDQRGTSSRFQLGRKAHNKGIRRPAGWGPGRMKQTQFKPGQRQGIAAQHVAPVGTTRLCKNGYIQRKVSGEPGLKASQAWAFEHRLLWEEHLGPVPPRHKVVFKNGDKSDLRINNLALIHSRVLMARNTLHNYPKDIALAIQLRGVLHRALRAQTQQEDL